MRAQHAIAMKIESDSAYALVAGAIMSAVLAIIGTIVTKLFGRKKDEADAQALGVTTLTVVIGKLETERDALVTRLVECERDNRQLQRRNMLLERTLSQNDIDVPPNNVENPHDA